MRDDATPSNGARPSRWVRIAALITSLATIAGAVVAVVGIFPRSAQDDHGKIGTTPEPVQISVAAYRRRVGALCNSWLNEEAEVRRAAGSPPIERFATLTRAWDS